MDVISRFTAKNLKENKRRTIVTIIAVVLSTALITAVAGMTTTLFGSLVKYYTMEEGSYHVELEDVPAEEIGIVRDNVHVERVGLTEDLGYAVLEGSGYEYKPYLKVMGFDETALSDVALKVKEGRLPENDSEIVVSENTYSLGNVRINVGDTLNLQLGTRIWNGEPLEKNSIYVTESDAEEKIKEMEMDGGPKREGLVAEAEHLEITSEKTYTVVGIIERPSDNVECFMCPGFSVITKLTDISAAKEVNAFMTFDSPKKAETYASDIQSALYESSRYTGGCNVNELVKLYGGVGDNILFALYLMAGVVIFIIVGTSAFVIGNSFSISVSEKKIQYGMLASIGATKKQIKKTVLREGAFIGGIGIVLGIILGTVVVAILCVVMTILLGRALGMDIDFYMPIGIFLVSILFAALTSYLSCVIPAHRAMKMSPIEAIRGNSEVKLNGKKLKTGKLIRKLFGIGGVISAKNLKRNRRQYRTTVISLVLAVAVFISLSTFLSQAKKLVVLQYKDVGYDVEIYCGSATLEGVRNLYNEVKMLEEVDICYCETYMVAAIDQEKYGTDDLKKYIAGGNGGIETQNGEMQSGLMIVEMSSAEFETFAKECGVKAEDYDKVAILEDDCCLSNDGNDRRFDRVYTVKEGDKLDLAIFMGETDENGQTKSEVDHYSVEITKITDERPIGFRGAYSDGGFLIVSSEYFKNCEAERYSSRMYITTENPNKVDRDVNNILKKNSDYAGVMVENEAEQLKAGKNLLTLVEIFLYGFITVITLIGVTNVFNTITTNMNLRSREFAMLRSIGMTKKEFDHMIRMESIMYGAKSLLFGVPIGLVLSRLIYTSLRSAFDFGYSLPIIPIIISIAFVAVIVGFTMKFSIGKINKQNIIDTIRKQTY